VFEPHPSTRKTKPTIVNDYRPSARLEPNRTEPNRKTDPRAHRTPPQVIKGRPTKVIEVTTSKTGKHGHAKCHFTAVDIFTNKKMEELVPSSHNLEVPLVNRVEYTLLDIDEDEHMSLMTEGGDTREDLKLPGGHDEAEKLADQIRDGFEAGKELVVTILQSMGIEQASAVKEINS